MVSMLATLLLLARVAAERNTARSAGEYGRLKQRTRAPSRVSRGRYKIIPATPRQRLADRLERVARDKKMALLLLAMPSMAFTAPGATRWHELASYSFGDYKAEFGKAYSTAEEEAHRKTD